MKLKFYSLCLIFFFFAFSVFAQPVSFRNQLKNEIQSWGSCRTVAITRTGGIAVYGSNWWFATANVPRNLTDEIRKLTRDGEFINDVVLTEQGRWVILYGNNGLIWDGISSNDSLLAKLREHNESNQTILSVAFNDIGGWAVITPNNFSASDSELLNWLVEGSRQFGQLWTVFLSDDAMIAIYENGYRSKGPVPQSLLDNLNRSNIEFYMVKFSGAAWFFADIDGNYMHNF